MKKLITTLFYFFVLCGTALSQAMIGYSISEIKKEHSDVEWKYSKWGEKEQYPVIGFEDESMFVMYYFGDKDFCFGTAIVPKTEGVLQGMVEKYNKKYVVVDDSHWKYYTANGILRCSLEMTEDKNYYFYWTN